MEATDIVLGSSVLLAAVVVFIGYLYDKLKDTKKLEASSRKRETTDSSCSRSQLDHLKKQPFTTSNDSRNLNEDSALVQSERAQNLQNYPHHFAIGRSSLRNQYDFEDPAKLRGQHDILTTTTTTTGEQQNETQPIPAPVASGSNPSCVNWVNELLNQIFSQHQRYSSILGESLLSALNEKLNSITNSSRDYCNLIVEFSNIKRELSSRPLIDDVRCDTEQNEKSISVLFNCYYQKLVMDLVIQPAPMAIATISSNIELGSYDLVSKSYYEVSIENLDGIMKSIISLGSKLIITDFKDKPDFKISLSPVERNHQELISEDALISMLIKGISQAVIAYYYGDDPELPQGRPSSSKYMERLNQLRDGATEIGRQLRQKISPKERKALIKIIRANNINYNQDVTCLMEFDHAQTQIQLTSTKSGSNPFWDEHFMFHLSEKSSDLIIELWDSLKRPENQSSAEGSSGRPKLISTLSANLNNGGNILSRHSKPLKSSLVQGAKFLGSARLSVEQMRQNPMQKVTLQLLSGPVDSSQQTLGAEESSLQSQQRAQRLDFDGGQSMAAGELLVELTFIEHWSAASNIQHVQRSPSGNSISRLVNEMGTQDQQQQASLSSQALGKVQNLFSRSHSPSQISSTKETLSTNDRPGTGDSGATQGTNEELRTEDQSNLVRGGEIRRSRSRSRSILRALRRRFSFSNRRSHSASGSISREATETPDGQSGMSRSRMSSQSSLEMHHSGAKSMPNSREPSEVPTIVINRSALDGPDALSFKQAKSQLVFECQEPATTGSSANNQQDDVENMGTVTKYYAIDSDSLARRWRKKGIKLHLFNEHQFVACHLSGSPTCHNCGRIFSRRPGKQGYRCRKCHLLSHKECHVKVDHKCPYAPPEGLKMEHTNEDPPKGAQSRLFRSNSMRIFNWSPRSPSRRSSVVRSNQQQQQQQQQQHKQNEQDQHGAQSMNPRLSSRSISLEIDDR